MTKNNLFELINERIDKILEEQENNLKKYHNDDYKDKQDLDNLVWQYGQLEAELKLLYKLKRNSIIL